MLSVWSENLELYYMRKWWKFEQFRFILIIFKVHATEDTAQLDFCGRYELSHVLPTPLCYWFDLRITLESYTLKKRWKFEQFRSSPRKNSKYHFTYYLYFFWIFLCALSWASVGVIDWNRVLPTSLAFLHSLTIFVHLGRYNAKWDSL